ncbi:ABC transporter permease [Streptomyces sp. NPDC048603]|uniref:ABC transporter permease n=1 Tax=Streptomyces sp. NPDC048603 TaxID=3365577 RepID=UPI00371C4425
MTGRLSRPYGPLGGVVRAGVGRRRVQTAVIVLTVLLSVASSVLALGLLVASGAPFDRAFARQQGAHLTVQFDGTATTAAQLEATTRLPGVRAASGPYPLASVRFASSLATPPGFEPPPLTVAGRSSADGPVDRIGLVEGRWAAAPGEIVVAAASRQPGTRPGTRLTAGGTTLTVVGIGTSVGRSADAWVVPDQLTALAGGRPDRQMLYRLTRATTAAEVAAARDRIAAALPERALAGTQSHLDVRQAAQENTGAFVPFVTAFALLGLAMSVLVIGIVVSGAVSAATRRIGILKSLGFTPAQVARAYLGQALIPAAAGAALGVVLGNLLAVPVMAEVAEAYATPAVPIPLWADLVVAAGALLLVAATASGPALRAARLSTAQAIGTAGRAAAAGGHGNRIRSLLGRLPVPRPVSLGLAGPFARPARAASTAAAVAFGVLAVTFAVGLGSTLIAVRTDGDPDRSGDVTVRTLARPDESRIGIDPPPEPADPAAVARAIAARPDTGSSYRTAVTQVAVAGLTGGAPLVAYEGDASAGRHTMVSGRWFDAPGEAVAPTRFLRAAGVRVGDTVTLSEQGRTVRLRIAGEVFDLGGKGMTLRADLASVAGLGTRSLPSDFSVWVTPGTDPARYARELNAALEPLGAWAEVTGSGKSSVIRAMQALTGMLTLLLVAVAGLGVLNTVVLDTRDRVRDLGVFKALGMTPGQTVTQVLTSVTATGLVAGAIGVPLGVALHHWVMPAMGRAVGTTLPPADIDVYDPALLALLAPAGVLIAVAGALLPATWAARTATTRTLRTE